MAIRNWQQHSLYMDYSNLVFGYDKPSDIDMFLLTENKFLILGEIKNERGTYTTFQRSLLETIVNGYKYGGTILYITHNKKIENGDKKVDVSECEVKEYYWKGKWVKPKRFINVREAIDIFRKVKYR